MPEQQRVPDFFADGVKVQAGPFGFTLSLFLSDPNAGSQADGLGRPIARLRLAPELARALSTTLTQAVAQGAAADGGPAAQKAERSGAPANK